MRLPGFANELNQTFNSVVESASLSGPAVLDKIRLVLETQAAKVYRFFARFILSFSQEADIKDVASLKECIKRIKDKKYKFEFDFWV